MLQEIHLATFFTSDTHFYHAKAASFRGYASAEDMNEALIAKWNAKVRPGDTVYHLGDLSFASPKLTAQVVEKLRGRIHLIPGNHDKRLLSGAGSAALTILLQLEQPLRDLKISDSQPDGTSLVHRFVLCHFPLLSWNQAHYGAMHLHGHSHGQLKFPNPNARILDVGVDTRKDHAPYSLAEVLNLMKDRKYVAFDQHQEKENCHYEDEEG